MRMKHSKEPWYTVQHASGNPTLIHANGKHLAECWSLDKEISSSANAARIVACVNACAGLDNPEQIRSMYEQMKTGLYKLENHRIGKLMYERDELLRLVTLFREDYERWKSGGEQHAEDVYNDVMLYFNEQEGGKQ